MGRLTAAYDKVCVDLKECRAAMRLFPKDLWYMFTLKFLESYAYFSLSQVLVIYLHDEFGASDFEAGTAYGMFGAAITGWGLSLSWLNDNLGVKKSLLIGFSISTIASTIVACTTSKILLYITLFAFYPIGFAMGIPMLSVATKRYTNSKNRGFAFGLFYAVMNVAALMSGVMVDAFTIGVPEQGMWSGYRLLIFSCTVGNILSVVVTYFFLRDIKILEDDEIAAAEENLAASVEMTGDANKSLQSNNAGSPLHGQEKFTLVDPSESPSEELQRDSSVATFTPKKSTFATILKELMTSPTFRRFAVLSLILVNLRAIFRHLDATQPTYLVRCFGDNVPKGSLYAINPFMIIFLTPVVAAVTNTYDHYNMIKYGGYVAAASPFFLACFTEIWAVACMNIVLSLGEAIYSPRLYLYTMIIAPEGREASFSALASAPLFAAKIPVGIMSGLLLQAYVPEPDDDDERCNESRAQIMWLIIALVTMSSPILITLFEKCLREPGSAGKQVPSDVSEKADLTSSEVLALELRGDNSDEVTAR